MTISGNVTIATCSSWQNVVMSHSQWQQGLTVWSSDNAQERSSLMTNGLMGPVVIPHLSEQTPLPTYNNSHKQSKVEHNPGFYSYKCSFVSVGWTGVMLASGNEADLAGQHRLGHPGHVRGKANHHLIYNCTMMPRPPRQHWQTEVSNAFDLWLDSQIVIQQNIYKCFDSEMV